MNNSNSYNKIGKSCPLSDFHKMQCLMYYVKNEMITRKSQDDELSSIGDVDLKSSTLAWDAIAVKHLFARYQHVHVEIDEDLYRQ